MQHFFWFMAWMFFPHHDEKEEGYIKNSVNLVASLPILSLSFHKKKLEMLVHVNEAG
jgi:hypothetical protein